jgi:hypothetical protein
MELSVWACTTLTSLDLSHAVQLHSLLLPCLKGNRFTSLALPPNTQLGVLQMASPDLLASLISGGRIAAVDELTLHWCQVDANVVTTVPGLVDLRLQSCAMPEQWLLSSLPALKALTVSTCTGLTSLDASAATTLTFLKLEGLNSLKSFVPPTSLKSLTCERLPKLADVDLSVVPDVVADFTSCPALRLSYGNLTIKP